MYPPRRETSRRVVGGILIATGLLTLVTVFWFPLNSLPYAPAWWDFAFLPHFSRIVTIACWLLLASGVAATASGTATIFYRHAILDTLTQAVALFTLFSTVLGAGSCMVMMSGVAAAWEYGGIGYFALGPLWLGALASIVTRFMSDSKE